MTSSVTLDSSIDVDRIFIFSNMPPSTDRITAALRDELRRVVALYCMDVIYRKDPMKVNAMRTLMFDLFHGNSSKNIISHVDLLCRGDDIFSDLFEDRQDNVVNRRCQDEAIPPKQLKPLYSRAEKPYVLGKHITVEAISNASFNRPTLVSGRTLLSNAQDTLRTIKKACCTEAV